MKFNIAYPSKGSQALLEVDDERNIRHVLDKRIAQEVDGSVLGDEFADYKFKITGGFDKQGFPMKQGVLVPDRVRLLLTADSGCYRPKRKGERRRRSVRGCVVSREIAVVNMVVTKVGKATIPNLTDRELAQRLGPKRANNIRKFFNLGPKENPCSHVIRRELPKKEGRKTARKKAPKVQRLITPQVLQRKRANFAQKRQRIVKNQREAAAYAALLAKKHQAARAATASKKSKSVRLSQKK